MAARGILLELLSPWYLSMAAREKEGKKPGREDGRR
jgi:hypothetical protein